MDSGAPLCQYDFMRGDNNYK